MTDAHRPASADTLSYEQAGVRYELIDPLKVAAQRAAAATAGNLTISVGDGNNYVGAGDGTNVIIGGAAPVCLQSMTNTYTHCIDDTVAQVNRPMR